MAVMGESWPHEELPAVLASIAARAAEHDHDGSFPFEAFDALYTTGALRLTIPVAAGGLGGGLAAATELVVAVGEADPSVALVLAQHVLFHAGIGEAGWPAGRLAAVRASALEGIALIDALRVEPDLGTPHGRPAGDGRGAAAGRRGLAADGPQDLQHGHPAAALAPRLRPHGRPRAARRQLPGAGRHARRPRRADLGPARHAGDAQRRRRVRGGGRAARSWARPRPDGAAADPDLDRLELHPDGGRVPRHRRTARDWVARYLTERTPANLGAPLSSLPRFQEAVGRIDATVVVGDQLLRTTAAAFDAGDPAAVRQSMIVKHQVTNGAIDAVMEAVRLTGNPGLLRANPLERHLRNVLHGRVHTPQDDTILVAAGKAAFAAHRG